MIDGVVSVGPLECMPNKICEAQFFHVAEKEGLPSLTLSLNGDPVDPEVVDNFAFEVHQRFRAGRRPAPRPRRRKTPAWIERPMAALSGVKAEERRTRLPEGPDVSFLAQQNPPPRPWQRPR
jgi:hypothetical protein